MKWSILGLFVLGVLAAVASVVLMLSFRTRGAVQPELEAKTAEQQEARKVQVLVAAVDLGLRDVIDADDVTEQTVEEGAAPSGSFSDPVQVVGKVLILPMAKGQPFRAECFATDESGLLLASALAPGSRAVSVTLSDDMGIEDLLFPGCMVDVIATVEMESPVSGKVPVSFTLLEKVMVLGVGTSTIVLGSTESSDGGRDRPGDAAARRGPGGAREARHGEGKHLDLDAQSDGRIGLFRRWEEPRAPLTHPRRG